MAVYTYAGNRDAHDKTETITVVAQGVTVRLKIGEHADFTAGELDEVDNRFLMTPGASGPSGTTVYKASTIDLVNPQDGDLLTYDAGSGNIHNTTPTPASNSYTDAAIATEVTNRNAAIAANGSSGRELAYVELNTSLTGQGNTNYSTGPNLTIPDFTIGARPVYVIISASVQFSGTNAVQLALTQSNLTVIAEQQYFIGTAFGQITAILRKRLTTAGTYSGYQIHSKTASSTYGLIAGTGSASFQALVEEK